MGIRYRIKEAFNKSITGKLYKNAGNKISDSFNFSRFKHIIGTNGRANELFSQGFFGYFTEEGSRSMAIGKHGRKLSSKLDDSKSLGYIRSLCQKATALKLSDIGTFLLLYLLTASCSLMIAFFLGGNGWQITLQNLQILFYSSSGNDFEFDLDIIKTLLWLVSLLLISLSFKSSKLTIAGLLNCNRLLSVIFNEYLGIDTDEKLRKSEKIKLSPTALKLVASIVTVFGFASPVLKPESFFSLVLYMFIVLIIFSKPEAGVVIIAFVFPFNSVATVAGIKLIYLLIGALILSYIGKLFLGKREFSVRLIDLPIFLIFFIFLIICIEEKAFSLRLDIADVTIYMLIYLLFTNLIRTHGWFMRTVNAFVYSTCLTLFCGIAIYLLKLVPHIGLVISDFDFLSEMYITGENTNVHFLIIPVLPFLLAATTKSKPRRKVNFVFYTLIAFFTIAFSGGNPVAIFSVAVSVAVYILCIKPQLFLLATPSLLLLLVPAIKKFALEKFYLLKEAIFTCYEISKNTAIALRDFIFYGVGFGEKAFSSAFASSEYAQTANNAEIGSSVVKLIFSLGLPGFLLITFALCVYMREIFGFVMRSSRKDTVYFMSASAASVVGYTFAALFSSAFDCTSLYLQMFVIISVSAAYVRVVQRETGRENMLDLPTAISAEIIIHGES